MSAGWNWENDHDVQGEPQNWQKFTLFVLFAVILALLLVKGSV